MSIFTFLNVEMWPICQGGGALKVGFKHPVSKIAEEWQESGYRIPELR